MTAASRAAGGLSRSAADGRSPWLIAGVVSIATFMEVLDVTITTVSLDHIAGSLAVSYDEATWISTSYLVSNAIVLPLSGWLATVIGRKRFQVPMPTMETCWPVEPNGRYCVTMLTPKPWTGVPHLQSRRLATPAALRSRRSRFFRCSPVQELVEKQPCNPLRGLGVLSCHEISVYAHIRLPILAVGVVAAVLLQHVLDEEGYGLG